MEDVQKLGYSVIERRSLVALGLTVTRLRLPAGVSPLAGRQQLEKAFPQLMFDVNSLYQPQGDLSLPAPSYPRRLIGWGPSSPDCGAGRLLGMIDSAVDDTGPALAGKAIVQRSFLGGGVRPADEDHGTAVAGLLIGRAAGIGPEGLLPGAGLDAAAVFEMNAGGEPLGNVLAVAMALDWLIGADVPVVNMSLAGDANRLLKLGIDRALARRMVIVAAAGNQGPEAGPSYPAAYPGVLAETAVDDHKQIYDRTNQGDFIAFAAPGVKVWAPSVQGGRYVTGTSFAAPYVTGAVMAALMTGSPRDLEAVTARLAGNVVDLGAPGRDPVFGWGLLRMSSPCRPAP